MVDLIIIDVFSEHRARQTKDSVVMLSVKIENS